jgi:hypothetical protein
VPARMRPAFPASRGISAPTSLNRPPTSAIKSRTPPSTSAVFPRDDGIGVAYGEMNVSDTLATMTSPERRAASANGYKTSRLAGLALCRNIPRCVVIFSRVAAWSCFGQINGPSPRAMGFIASKNWVRRASQHGRPQRSWRLGVRLTAWGSPAGPIAPGRASGGEAAASRKAREACQGRGRRGKSFQGFTPSGATLS